MSLDFDIIVIGAGPAGSLSSALLAQRGYRVCVVERNHFPRFAVGESMLPYSIEIMAEANMLEAVAKHGFQRKEGVLFHNGHQQWLDCDFSRITGIRCKKAINVERASFDHILIQQAQRFGVQVRFGETVVGFENSGTIPLLQIQKEDGRVYETMAAFVLDASGYFHALPRLLGWERKPSLQVRQVHFTHIDDHIPPEYYDRSKSLVIAHPDDAEIWFSFVPLSAGRSSISVVAPSNRFDEHGHSESILRHYVSTVPTLASLLQHAVWQNGFPFYFFPGYSSSVKALHGRHFALLGNSGEFIDPLFSSGVAAAVHAARLAASLVDKTLRGLPVDWQHEFDDAVGVGNHVFRTLVEAWYNGTFQQILFDKPVSAEMTNMLYTILAGYAWDMNNAYVHTAAHYPLASFAEIISALEQEISANKRFQAA